MKTVRKDVKRRWRNNKGQEKALKNAEALKPAGLINDQKPKDDLDIKQPSEHRREKPACSKHWDKSSDVKEINLVDIVCTEKSLGCGTFSICYHAYYSSIPRYLRQRANHRAGFFKWTNQSEGIDMTQ